MPTSPVPYAVVQSAGERVSEMAQDGGATPHWLAYVGVSDVVAATVKARALGATIEVEPRAFGERGQFSVLVDPTGARLALWEASSSELVHNDWGVFLDHGDLIELRWVPSPSAMTDGGFMATLSLFARRRRRLGPGASSSTRRSSDTRSGVMDWRDAQIIPRYGAAGVRGFAFLMPAGFPKAGSEGVEGPAIFPTKWFVDRKEALNWLRAE